MRKRELLEGIRRTGTVNVLDFCSSGWLVFGLGSDFVIPFHYQIGFFDQEYYRYYSFGLVFLERSPFLPSSVFFHIPPVVRPGIHLDDDRQTDN